MDFASLSTPTVVLSDCFSALAIACVPFSRPEVSKATPIDSMSLLIFYPHSRQLIQVDQNLHLPGGRSDTAICEEGLHLYFRQDPWRIEWPRSGVLKTQPPVPDV